MLHLKNGKKFKIDFNYYPEPRINISKKYKNLHIDSIKVTTISDFPKMLIPFDKKAMEDFFLKLAKSLEGEIFK